MISCVKAKIVIALSSDVLAKIDRLVGPKRSRSEFIEEVLQLHFRQMPSREIDARDMELINAAADRLNVEAEDALTYQASKDKDNSHN
jgi:metal-responsive CopG/Arc/MetJ family transcriptional regulator